MGDVINYFGDTSRVESASLIKTMVNMAGAAKQFGLSVESTAALTTAFAKMGYDAEKAGSIVTQMLPKLGLVANETNKSMTEAAKRIGIIPETLRCSPFFRPKNPDLTCRIDPLGVKTTALTFAIVHL
jgi:TP901 family phage tail tape measure protein